MKRIALFITLLLNCMILCSADDLSYAAKNFRSNIQSFLREEGFSPSIDNDGSLCFKKEGISYWIDVIGDKPFYVTFHREPLRTEDASSTDVLKAVNDVNTNIRAIKCCYGENYVTFSIESYCYVAEDFKYVFYNYLGILEASRDLIKEAYAQYDSSSSYSNSSSNRGSSSSGSTYRSNSTSTSSTSGSKKSNSVYVNGPILETSYHKWWCTAIELNSYNTIVHKVVVPKTANTYVYSTSDEYIEDCDTGKKYYIQSSSIGLGQPGTTLYTKDSKAFTDTFPALPSSVKRINIWSGSDYYAKNLQIR
jgi:hypothetical protein